MITIIIRTKSADGGGDSRDMSNGDNSGAASAVCCSVCKKKRTVSPSSTVTATAVLVVWTMVFIMATVVGGSIGGSVQALTAAGSLAGGSGVAAAAAVAAAGRMAPCAHLGDETNDVSARAYASDVVFEGKVRSKGPVRPGAGIYGVTFVVQRVHKDAMQAVTYEGLRVGSPVRLYFREKRGNNGGGGVGDNGRDPLRRLPRRADAQCVQRFAPAAGGQTVEANIKRGAKYLVFVAGVGPHNLSVLGEPVLRTPKNVDAVRKVLCRNCSEYKHDKLLRIRVFVFTLVTQIIQNYKYETWR